MRIALILTGGTICSRVQADGARRSDVDTAVTVLEQHYRAQKPFSSVEFDVHMPMNALSEDLTPDDWCTLLRTVASLDYDGLSGIIIAHGTDTLDQTAGMLSAALAGIPVPVVLVSAIAPLDDPMSNGHANFEAAVSVIAKHLCAGVWVVYENIDGIMYLHRGCELLPCEWGSRSFFSAGMQPAARLLESEEYTYQKSACLDRQALYQAAASAKEVLLIRPYNGMRYDKIALDGVTAIVHGTYHSETANASMYSPYSVQTLLMRCRAANIPCFLAPCAESGQDYGSSFDLVQAGAIPLENMPLSFAYGAVWACCLTGYSGERLVSRVRQLRESLQSQPFLCCM